MQTTRQSGVSSISRAKVEKLYTSEKIRVYTFQSLTAMEAARARGWWGGNPDFETDEIFAQPYRWMMDRMAERITGYTGDPPVWVRPNRPSLRKPFDGVLVTAIVPTARILWSEFGLWHDVLNDRPIYDCEKDFDNEILEAEADKRKSWEKCLDLNYGGWGYSEWLGDMRTRRAQGCADRIYANEVIGVRRYRNK